MLVTVPVVDSVSLTLLYLYEFEALIRLFNLSEAERVLDGAIGNQSTEPKLFETMAGQCLVF